MYCGVCSSDDLQPCVIFMDEIDALGSSRDSGDNAQGRRVLAELLLQVKDAVHNRAHDCT